MKVCLLQTNSINKNSSIYKNIELFYEKNKDLGYVKHPFYLEYPTWILQVGGILKDCEIQVVTVIDLELDYLRLDCDYCFISIMNSNKHNLLKIINNNKNVKFIAGDYTISNYNISNLTILDGIYNLCTHDVFKNYTDYSKLGTLNYSIFPKEQSIPRIQLSKNCNHNCKFCTIGTGVFNLNEDVIHNQINSLKNADFKLVYIDDKTFGQSDNISYIQTMNYMYNCKFIVQTSFVYLDRLIKNNNYLFEYIDVIEFGLETYNDKILKYYNKPIYKSIKKSTDLVFEASEIYNFKIIFNIIVGFPEETIFSYLRTLYFIYKNKNKILNLNIYPYSNYDDDSNIEDEYKLKGIHKWMLKQILKLQKQIIMK